MQHTVELARVMGGYRGEEKGAILAVLAGVHGNELSGLTAVRRVLNQLEEQQPDFKGTLVAIRGNIPAIQRKVRFIDKDLNRLWFSEQVERIENTPRHLLTTVEDIQQKELITLFKYQLRQQTNRPIVLLDLHTTSAEGGTFALCNPIELSQKLARSLGVPVIGGVESIIKGTTLNYFTEIGMTAVGFEAGQHDNPEAISRMEAAIWMSLKSLRCVDQLSIPNFKDHHERLQQLGAGKPSKVQFVHRHHIKEGDGFKMRPGYKNFQAIQKGEILADDRRGEIASPMDGMILMPLYQDQGEDGFFVVK